MSFWRDKFQSRIFLSPTFQAFSSNSQTYKWCFKNFNANAEAWLVQSTYQAVLVVGKVKLLVRLDKSSSEHHQMRVTVKHSWQPWMQKLWRLLWILTSLWINSWELQSTPEYWFPRITSRTAGLTKSSTTNSSATLETQGASEIGLKSFFRSSTGFFLGRGGTSAIFQMVGNRCSRYDALRICVMGKARMSEYSFKSQFGTLSGPDALLWLRFAKTYWTRSSLTVKNLGVSSRGRWASGSCNL